MNHLNVEKSKISYLPFRLVRTEKYFPSVLKVSLVLRSRAASKTSGKYFFTTDLLNGK